MNTVLNIAAKLSQNLEMEDSERFFVIYNQLSRSVDNLRGSINRYESYKKRKPQIVMEPNDD